MSNYRNRYANRNHNYAETNVNAPNVKNAFSRLTARPCVNPITAAMTKIQCENVAHLFPVLIRRVKMRCRTTIKLHTSFSWSVLPGVYQQNQIGVRTTKCDISSTNEMARLNERSKYQEHQGSETNGQLPLNKRMGGIDAIMIMDSIISMRSVQIWGNMMLHRISNNIRIIITFCWYLYDDVAVVTLNLTFFQTNGNLLLMTRHEYMF